SSTGGSPASVNMGGHYVRSKPARGERARRTTIARGPPSDESRTGAGTAPGAVSAHALLSETEERKPILSRMRGAAPPRESATALLYTSVPRAWLARQIAARLIHGRNADGHAARDRLELDVLRADQAGATGAASEVLATAASPDALTHPGAAPPIDI